MKKWQAALLLSITLGVFAGSGIACGASSGCISCGEEQSAPTGGSTDKLTALSKPKVSLTGAKATWEAVEGAKGYVYKIGSKGEETKVDEPVVVTLKNGEKLYVKAVGDGKTTKDSAWATSKTCEIELTPLSAPTNVAIDEYGFASWSPVAGAASYTYIVRDAEGNKVAEETTKQTYTKEALKVGQTVEVKANGDNETTSGSGYGTKVECESVKDSSQQGGSENEKPDDVIDPDDVVPGEVYDPAKLGAILNIDNINWNALIEVGDRAEIPIVYAKYDGKSRKAFAWVTRNGGEVVEVVSRGTRFLVDTMDDYTVEYYINVGGPQKIAERTIKVKDTQGPTFKLPASADGMLAYANKPLNLPASTAYDYSFDGGESNATTISVRYGSTNVPVTNGTFMIERSSLRAVPLNSFDWSRKS